MREGASNLKYVFLCKRVLRFLRRRFEHFYDTPAALAETLAALTPLLGSRDQIDATLTAVAVRGLVIAAPRRHRGRFARAAALPMYAALLAAPLTSPLLVEALANCLDYCCTYSERAVFKVYALGSPVPVRLPVSDHGDEEAANGSDEITNVKLNDDAQDPESSQCASDHSGVDLLPTSFDNCAEFALLRLAERALRTVPCTQSAYGDMAAALVTCAMKCLENRHGASYVVTDLFTSKCITAHYAASRVSAHSLVVAPLVGLVCKAFLDDTTSYIVNDDDAMNASTDARAKRDLFVKRASHRERLQQVIEMSRDLIGALVNNNLDTAMKLPFEKPEFNSAFLIDDFDSALWLHKGHVVDAWRAACDTALAAVRASVGPGVAAQIAAVRGREETNIHAYINAVLASKNRDRICISVPAALSKHDPVAALSAEALTANMMSLLPLLPVAPAPFFEKTLFVPWCDLMTAFVKQDSGVSIDFDNFIYLLTTVRHGCGFAFHRLLSPPVYAAGHRLVQPVVDLLGPLTSTPTLKCVTRGPLTARDTAAGERWRDGYALHEDGTPPVPRDAVSAGADLSQSHLDALLALLQIGEVDTVHWAAYLLILYVELDYLFYTAPGWEATPLLARAGLLPVMAATTRRLGGDVTKILAELLAKMGPILCNMAATRTSSGKDSKDGQPQLRPQSQLTEFQQQWLRENVVAPVRTLCVDRAFAAAVEAKSSDVAWRRFERELLTEL